MLATGEFDDIGFDNDNFLKTFEFDNHENNPTFDNNELKTPNDQVSDDLLGLTGSLINFGIFKSHQNPKNPNAGNVFKDQEFEIAFNKLDFVDKSPSIIHDDDRNFPEEENPVIEHQSSPIVPFANVLTDSPFGQLTKFSEMLHEQFQQFQKADTNLHVLNQIVSNHLNMLSKQLQLLNLSMDILPQLRYFRILMSFVAIDNRLTEIQTKFATNPTQLSAEIAQIIHHFSLQPRQQQVELCLTHPFYHNLMNMLLVNSNQGGQKRFPSPKQNNSLPEWASNDDKQTQENWENRRRNFSENEGGWMSDSERDWLIKIQTRNLVTDNPYVHDYYYTKLKLRELTETRALQIVETGHTMLADPLSLLPSPITGEQLEAGSDATREGGGTSRPPTTVAMHFEKSLGMLSPSSLHTPRQILQLAHHSSSARDVTPSPLATTVTKPQRVSRGYRELLGLIEKMYSIVLRIDEVDKSLARMLVEQHRSRGVLVQHRNYLLKLLVDCLTNSGRFVDLLSVAKGARIVVATVAIVKAPQFVQVLRTVFFNCISVCESRFFRDVEAELRSVVCSRVRSLSGEELSLLLTTFYCNVTPGSLAANDAAGGGCPGTPVRLQPLAGFCSSEVCPITPHDAPIIDNLSFSSASTSSSPCSTPSSKRTRPTKPTCEYCRAVFVSTE